MEENYTEKIKERIQRLKESARNVTARLLRIGRRNVLPGLKDYKQKRHGETTKTREEEIEAGGRLHGY